jgi:hypothetical protein
MDYNTYNPKTSIIPIKDTPEYNTWTGRISLKAKDELRKVYLPYVDICIDMMANKVPLLKHGILPNGLMIKKNRDTFHYTIVCWCYRDAPHFPPICGPFNTYQQINKQWEKNARKCRNFRKITTIAKVYPGTQLKFTQKEQECYQIFLNEFYNNVAEKKNRRDNFKRLKKYLKRESKEDQFDEMLCYDDWGYHLPTNETPNCDD